jgi:hypothetical protein
MAWSAFLLVWSWWCSAAVTDATLGGWISNFWLGPTRLLQPRSHDWPTTNWYYFLDVLHMGDNRMPWAHDIQSHEELVSDLGNNYSGLQGHCPRVSSLFQTVLWCCLTLWWLRMPQCKCSQGMACPLDSPGHLGCCHSWLALSVKRDGGDTALPPASSFSIVHGPFHSSGG